MQVALHSLVFPDPKGILCFEVLKDIKRLGYSGIELIPIDCTIEDIKQLRIWTEQLGMTVLLGWSLGPEHNLISADHIKQRAGIAKMKELIDFGVALVAPILAGLNYAGAGYFTGRPPSSEEWSAAVRSYREICDYSLSKSGPMLCIEPATREDSHLINTVEQGIAFLQDVDRPNARLLLDTYQMLREEDAVGRAILAAGPCIGYFHVSESHRGTPGRGTVPWKDVFSALASVSYQGWLGVEAFFDTQSSLAPRAKVWRQLANDPMTLARDALVFIETEIAKAEPR